MALWSLGGGLFRVRVWSLPAWGLTPVVERPRAVVRIAGGLMAVEPVPAGADEAMTVDRFSTVPQTH